MNISLKQLEIFVTIVECGNFTEAGRRLYLAQSTVSKHLACLRDCGLVRVRIEGRASWFSLADPVRLADLIESAAALLSASGVSLSRREHHDHEGFATSIEELS